MTTMKKRKVSVSLDDDLVTELEASDDPVSTQVNSAIRAELERRRRGRLLDEFLLEVEAAHGPPDEAVVRKYMDLLG